MDTNKNIHEEVTEAAGEESPSAGAAFFCAFAAVGGDTDAGAAAALGVGELSAVGVTATEGFAASVAGFAASVVGFGVSPVGFDRSVRTGGAAVVPPSDFVEAEASVDFDALAVDDASSVLEADAEAEALAAEATAFAAETSSSEKV